MIVVYIPIVVMLVGLVIYLATLAGTKTSEVGRIMFKFGLLVSLLTLGHTFLLK